MLTILGVLKDFAMLPYDNKVSAAKRTPPSYTRPTTEVPVVIGRVVCCLLAIMTGTMKIKDKDRTNNDKEDLECITIE